MELKAQTAKLWQRFESQGTLGSEAKREKMGMMESMETVGYELAADSLHRFDNSEIDSDPRPGFTKFTKADFTAKLEGELNQQMPGLMNSEAKLDPKEMEEMVQAGIFTKEEAAQMMQDVNTEDTKKNCTSEGEVSKSPDGTIFSVQVTTGDENDIEYIRTGADGLRLLHVEPSGNGFTAKGIYSKDGETYKETLSGDWNLIQ